MSFISYRIKKLVLQRIMVKDRPPLVRHLLRNGLFSDDYICSPIRPRTDFELTNQIASMCLAMQKVRNMIHLLQASCHMKTVLTPFDKPWFRQGPVLWMSHLSTHIVRRMNWFSTLRCLQIFKYVHFFSLFFFHSIQFRWGGRYATNLRTCWTFTRWRD